MTSIFPKEDLQKIHVSETSAIECFNLLQRLCKHDHEFVTENGAKTKMYYVKNTSGHKFKIRHKIFSPMIFTQRAHAKLINFKKTVQLILFILKNKQESDIDANEIDIS